VRGNAACRPADYSADRHGLDAHDCALGDEVDSSEPKGQELVYAARVSLDTTEIKVEENTVSLSPGMAVTVEIKTGSRSMISYLLSPLGRYKQESLRER
jgi:hemolysin D